MVEIIMKEFNKIETDIEDTLNKIYAVSLPDTPNPLHSYMRLGDIDQEYLTSIASSISSENPAKKKHQNELALLKAKNVKKRQNILPIVHKSLQLLGHIFSRKADKHIIPRFYNERPDFPLSMEPNFTIDNFYISR